MLFQRSLTTVERLLGPEHPNVAAGLNNLGALYHEQRRPAEAEETLLRALVVAEKALARTIHECGSSGAHGTDFACFVCSTGRRVGDQTVVAGLD